jgi:hypothetical protein
MTTMNQRDGAIGRSCGSVAPSTAACNLTPIELGIQVSHCLSQCASAGDPSIGVTGRCRINADALISIDLQHVFEEEALSKLHIKGSASPLHR